MSNTNAASDSTSNQLVAPSCGHCDNAVGILALVGEQNLYCSISCLIFANDSLHQTATQTEGGET